MLGRIFAGLLKHLFDSDMPIARVDIVEVAVLETGLVPGIEPQRRAKTDVEMAIHETNVGG
ncbi:MAG: hypothetical protein JJD98_15650 [Polaromonas sp.]|nr:hypothetical protein [Polaromonas sp.]